MLWGLGTISFSSLLMMCNSFLDFSFWSKGRILTTTRILFDVLELFFDFIFFKKSFNHNFNL